MDHDEDVEEQEEDDCPILEPMKELNIRETIVLSSDDEDENMEEQSQRSFQNLRPMLEDQLMNTHSRTDLYSGLSSTIVPRYDRPLLNSDGIQMFAS